MKQKVSIPYKGKVGLMLLGKVFPSMKKFQFPIRVR